MTESQIIPLVTGPASALGICLLIGLGVYRIIGNSLVPMLQRAIDRHLDSVDGSLEKIDRKVGGIYARLGDLKDAG
jgi:hypothetical protein